MVRDAWFEARAMAKERVADNEFSRNAKEQKSAEEAKNNRPERMACRTPAVRRGIRASSLYRLACCCISRQRIRVVRLMSVTTRQRTIVRSDVGSVFVMLGFGVRERQKKETGWKDTNHNGLKAKERERGKTIALSMGSTPQKWVRDLLAS